MEGESMHSSMPVESLSASVVTSIFSFMWPPSTLDWEYVVATYWWVFLVSIITLFGVFEYARVYWQDRCDRQRLKTFKERCAIRKSFNRVLHASSVSSTPLSDWQEGPRDTVDGTSPYTGDETAEGSGMTSLGGSGLTPVFGTRGTPRPESTVNNARAARGAGNAARSAFAALANDADEEEQQQRMNPSSMPCTNSSATLLRQAGTPPLSPAGLSNDGSSVVNGSVTDAEKEVLSAKTSVSSVTTPGAYCCPRYSADEQRRIEAHRQENINDWLEARRALESTSPATTSSGPGSITPAQQQMRNRELIQSAPPSITHRRTRASAEETK